MDTERGFRALAAQTPDELPISKRWMQQLADASDENDRLDFHEVVGALINAFMDLEAEVVKLRGAHGQATAPAPGGN